MATALTSALPIRSDLSMAETWLRAVLETYPEIDDLFLYVSESL